MKLHELTQTIAKPGKKRLGRGIGSGRGKTAGRGTKGQNSRTGGGVKLGFEGGQTKLSMRLPKARGFKAQNPTHYQIITLTDLNQLKTATVNKESLQEAGLIGNGLVKLLANGELTKKIKLSVDAASQKAIAVIEKNGGSVTLLKNDTIRSKAVKIDKVSRTKKTAKK